MTSLVHWHEGMFMRVQSLQMLQQGILERLEDMRRFQHHYPYGVVEAELAEDDLKAGKIRFTRLRAVLPNGLLVVVGADCVLPAFPVREELARSRSGEELTVCLAVPDYVPNQTNAFRLGEAPDPRVNYRYVPTEEKGGRADENTGDNIQPVLVRNLNARLMFSHKDKSGLEWLPLVKVRRARAGAGVDLALEFAPPCLFLSGAPKWAESVHSLSELVHSAVNKVEETRKRVAHRLRTQRLSMAALQGVQFQQWNRLLILSRQASRMLDLRESPHTTPFEMFLALHETLSELEALRPDVDPKSRPPIRYEHDDPYPDFAKLDSRLDKALEDAEAVEHLGVQFTADPNLEPNTVHAVVPPEWRGFFDIDKVAQYLLAVKTPLPSSAVERILINRVQFELAVPSQIGHAGGGLQLGNEVSALPGLPDLPDVHYFPVELPLPETDPVLEEIWNAVVAQRELAIALHPHPSLRTADFTFYAILKPSTTES